MQRYAKYINVILQPGLHSCPFAIRLLCQQFPIVNLQEPRHYPIPRKPSWVAVCFLAKRLCTFALQARDGAYTVFMFFFNMCVVWEFDSH